MPATIEPKPTELHAAIKRGIDARARCFHAARRFDGTTLLPVWKMSFGRHLQTRFRRSIQTNLQPWRKIPRAKRAKGRIIKSTVLVQATNSEGVRSAIDRATLVRCEVGTGRCFARMETNEEADSPP